MGLAYEEVVDFIAAGTTPDSVAAFRLSETTKARVADLIHQRGEFWHRTIHSS